LSKVTTRQRATVKKARRSRRSTEEITSLIIEAACDEFELNGYERAKTATIAQKAGVAEALIFSNFGSKSKLFHDAIFKPLEQHLLRFQTSHVVDAQDAEAMKAGTQQYIAELQQFIRQHSRMLKSVIAAQMYASDALQDLREVEGLHEFFTRASTKGMSASPDNLKIPPKLLTRVSFATILACIIFKDLLFPKGLASQAEIGKAISDFVMEGLNANAAPSMPAPVPAPKAARPRRPSAAAKAATRK
jgi:AcrR family transcriptional regulator